MRTVPEFSELFKQFVVDVLALMKKGRPTEAKHANQADTVDGHTLEDFRKDYLSKINGHIDAWNPHELSAWYLGSPTKHDVDEAFKKFLPTNCYPVSYFLKTNNGENYCEVQDKGNGSFKLILKQWPCVLSGTTHILPRTELDLNGETKVYVRLVRGRPTYFTLPNDQSLSESNTRMYLGKVSSSGMPSDEDKEITRVDLYRYATKPTGSAIPIVTGWDKDKDTPNMSDDWYPDPGHVFITADNIDEYRSFILPKGTYSVLLMSGGMDSSVVRFADGLIRETYPYYTVGAAGVLVKGRLTLDRPTRVGVELRSRAGRPEIIDWTTITTDNLIYSANGTYLSTRTDNGTSYTANLTDGSGKRITAAAVATQSYRRPYVKDGSIYVPVDAAHTQHMTIVTRNSSTYGMGLGDSSLMTDKAGQYRTVMKSVDPDITHGFEQSTWSGGQSKTQVWAAVYGTDGKTYNDFQTYAPGGFGDGMRQTLYFGKEATLYGSGLTQTSGYGYGAGSVHGAAGVPGFASFIKIA